MPYNTKNLKKCKKKMSDIQEKKLYSTQSTYVTNHDNSSEVVRTFKILRFTYLI